MSIRVCLSILIGVFARGAPAQEATIPTSGTPILLQVSVDDRAARTLRRPALRLDGTRQVELRDDGQAPDALANDHLFSGQVLSTRGLRTDIAILETVYGSPFVLGSGTVVIPDTAEDALTILIPPSGAGTFEARFASAVGASPESVVASAGVQGAPPQVAPMASGSSPVSLERIDPWPLLIGLLVLVVLVRAWVGAWYSADLGPLLRDVRRHLARHPDAPGRSFDVARFLESLQAREAPAPLPWSEPGSVLLVGGTRSEREAVTALLALKAIDRGAAVVLAGPEVSEWSLAERVVATRTGGPFSTGAARLALPALRRLEGRSASGPFRPGEAVEVLSRIQEGRGVILFDGLPAGGGHPLARAEAAIQDLHPMPPGVQAVWLVPADLVDADQLLRAVEGAEATPPAAALAECLAGVGVLEDGEDALALDVRTRAARRRVVLDGGAEGEGLRDATSLDHA